MAALKMKVAYSPPHYEVIKGNFNNAERAGIIGSVADMHRFAARYRVAKSFKGEAFEGFSPGVAKGYDSILRMFLAYSAMESLLNGLKLDNTKVALTIDWAERCQMLRDTPSSTPYLNFIAGHMTTKTIKAAYVNYLAGHTASLVLLAAGARHAFVHGHLTPSSGGLDGENTHAVCDQLASAVLFAIDTEIEERAKAVKALYELPSHEEMLAIMKGSNII